MKAKLLVEYCRSFNMWANLYDHFHLNLDENSDYPTGSPKLRDYRLSRIFHSKTPEHNKDVIIASFTKDDGVLRAVFATMAIGIGIDCVGLTQTNHYGMVLLGPSMATSRTVVELAAVKNRQLLLYTGARQRSPSARTMNTRGLKLLL